MTTTQSRPVLRAGMVGMGMIFDETYRPFFEHVHHEGLYDRKFGDLDVTMVAVATKTGQRADRFLKPLGDEFPRFAVSAATTPQQMLSEDLTFSVATPDDRHLMPANRSLNPAFTCWLKPSVLSPRNSTNSISSLPRNICLPVSCTTNCSIRITRSFVPVHDNVLQHE